LKKGDEQTANFVMYKEAIETLQMFKQITYKKGVTLTCDKFKNLIKGKFSSPFSSAADEICKYKIMMAEKVDRREISKEEYDYFVAQKQREIMESIRLQYQLSVPRTFIITPFGRVQGQ